DVAVRELEATLECFPGFQLGKVTPLAVLDIALVTLIIYGFLVLIRGTQADQLVRGALILLLATGLLGSWLNLTMLNWLVQNSLPAVLVSLPVVFQPELRRVLDDCRRRGREGVPDAG
ncbi:MAG: hypothetical protein EBS89_10895, partial [Proteobacteria bacterium]|nr:hypothetical protein [Pseudomonadota bacterium]